MSATVSGLTSVVGQNIFDPSLLFLDHSPTDSGTAIKSRSGLIILNRPFELDQAIVRAWKRADYQICADGGANRLWDACEGRDKLIERLGNTVRSENRT
jgi:hypothetical protein